MEYIIQTQNLTKKYKNDTVVNNLNLKIKEGEIIWPTRTKWCRKNNNNVSFNKSK